MRTAATLLVLLTALVPPGDPIFRFNNTFWPNLHHFLYVLGRAQGGARDAHRRAVAGAPKDAPSVDLTDEEQAAWKAATSWYQNHLSQRDAVFNRDLTNTTREIASIGDAPSLEGRAVSPALRDALDAAAPVYRRAWWPRHRDALARDDLLHGGRRRPPADPGTRHLRGGQRHVDERAVRAVQARAG